MQFWLKSALVVAMTSVMVGCTSSDEQVINEDHQYVNAQERGRLKVPAGFNPVEGDGSFALPEQRVQGDVGESLDLQSPPQLLALASGSRLDDKNHKNKIWFDRTTVVENLPVFTFDAMRNYLSFIDAQAANFNDQTKTVDTGWITDVREGSIWPWSDAGGSRGLRFETIQKTRAKGMIASVQANLTGMQINGKDVPLSTLTPNDRLRAEIEFMNGFIYYFQLSQEKLMKDAKIARVYDMTLKTGTDKNGAVVLRSEKNADVVWTSFRSLLEELGFTIEDVDRSSRKLFVSYNEEEKGFWRSLWDDDKAVEVNLAPGKYVVRVTSEQTKSAITWYDVNEQPMTADTYDNIIEPLVQVAKKLALEL